MAFSYKDYTGDGVTDTFTITFTYQDTNEISVTVDGVAETGLTFPSTTTVQLTSAPASDALVRVRRATSLTSRSVDFASGSVLTEEDLDNSNIQVFHAAQEAVDTAGDAVGLDSDDKMDAQSKIIKNVADPVNDQDAVTKNYLENTWLTTADKAQLNSLDTDNLDIVADDVTNVNTVATNISDVNTVAGNNANVTTVATDIANVNTVAADLNEPVSEIDTVANNITNVNTVGGISTDVTTVAGISSDVTAVAADTTDIGTVSSNISDVNTVAGISSDVTTVSGINAAVSSVAADATDIGTVSSNIANVNTVAGISVDVTTVAADGTDIGTVAANIANVNTVAANNTNVSTVAGISADVTAVAGISGDIQDVQDKLAEVQTVADDLQEVTSEIETVAASIANVDTVGGAITNVNTVATNVADVNTVAGIDANVTTVAGVAADVSTVAGISANVTTVANNVAGVNSFAERYRVDSSDPTTSLDEGDLFFNTTDNAYKFYDGSAWQTVNVSGIGSVLDDATPQLGGNLDVNGNDINFGDNDKAIFGGTTSELQIYSDGSNSYISDQGTGNLRILAQDFRVVNSANSETMIQANVGADVRLYYDTGVKLSTTSGGIDVTGTVTADGLTVDVPSGETNYDAIFLDAPSSSFRIRCLNTDDANPSWRVQTNTGEPIKFAQAGVDRFEIDSSGDISFYDSTGVTQGLFWDASTQRLGLGTSSPDERLHVFNGSSGVSSFASNTDVIIEDNGNTALQFASPNTSNNQIFFSDPESNTAGVIQYSHSTDAMSFDTNGNTRMTITSDGNVGIGTASPSTALAVNGTATVDRVINSGVATTASTPTYTWGGQQALSGMYLPASSTIAFSTNAQERLRINSSGSLLVGKTGESLTTTGHVLGVSGYLWTTRDDNIAHVLNRTTSDGAITQFRKDGTTVGSVSVTGTGTTYNTTSDIRLKTDIEPIDHATDMLMAMNPVSHRWKADPDADAVVGFIAQEMAEIVPEAVSKSDSEDEMMSMDYGRITPVLVAALQDAHKKIEELEARINKMEAE